ncbi:hypothetical protein [Halorubellus litoreus]|uniref:Uncharacterized protein n=1 Tax=Halorubellus litoreus TaxID=755308 RepID=A0ABD5VJW2_9EURY
MGIKASKEVKQLVNKNSGKSLRRGSTDKRFYPVTNATFKQLYPTKEWQSRYYQTVYGGR